MTPTDTVVSEERLREIVDGFAGLEVCADSDRLGPDETLEIARELLDRRTSTPQSGGVRLTAYEMQVLIGASMSGCVMRPDTTFNVQNAWKRLHDLGLIDRADGLAIATTTGRERIRSTLADPIPEAPADEEVEGLAQALRNLAEGAEQEDRTILYKAAAALRRSTETDKPGVREAVLEEAANAAFRAAQHVNANADDIATAIRALSASPLTEEQPTHRHKKRGTEYVLIGYGKMQAEDWAEVVGGQVVGCLPVDMREVAIYRSAADPIEIWVRPREEFEDGRFETLPRSTTGGAK